MDLENLGVVLERNRRRSNMTQAELAAEMGTRQPAISRAELGKVTPTLEFLERWVRATGQPLELDFDRRGARPRRLGKIAGRGKYRESPWDRVPYSRDPP